MNDAQTINLLGAFALALGDDVKAAAVSGAGHAANAPAAIVCIGNYPGETIDSLCTILGLSHSATVRLIDRLEADSLVTRRAGSDRRTAALHLTRQGKRRMGDILARRREVLTAALAALSSDERVALDRLLRKMLKAGTRGRDHADYICRLCDEIACPPDACPVESAV